jgi:hypothetical protein
MVVHVDGLEAVTPLGTGGGGVGGVETEPIGGESEPMWFTKATPMGVPAVINAAAIPPYSFTLGVDLELPGLYACDDMVALPPYAELVVIVVLPHGVFDRTDRRGVTHIDIGALQPDLTCT